jgi:pyridine nucleotide-disulfide oxidoreductase domain-containing protein 1
LCFKTYPTIPIYAVIEKELSGLPFKNLRWMQGQAADINTEQKHVTVCQHEKGTTVTVPYDSLCIATGARPRRLLDSPYVRVVRDTDSVAELATRLVRAQRVIVVGNGGIALELASALQGADVTWVLRQEHIGDAFFDVDASQFLLEELRRLRTKNVEPRSQSNDRPSANALHDSTRGAQSHQQQQQHGAPPHVTIEKQAGGKDALPMGHAVGPAWASKLPCGPLPDGGSFQVETGCEVIAITKKKSSPLDAQVDSAHQNGDARPCPPMPSPLLQVTLSDGRILEADVVISAIGVEPAVDWVPSCIQRGDDGGLLVDREMRTSVPGIYAAGDVCCAQLGRDIAPHWFQMRLWSQARTMGMWVAHCMAGVGETTGLDIAFEVFTHVTRFLGRKVIFLGLYNGQKLEAEPEEDMISYSRITEGPERTFVRILLLRGRIQGAVLIGDTDLEETMENLILDGLDVSQYGAALLDPAVDLDHVFD